MHAVGMHDMLVRMRANRRAASEEKKAEQTVTPDSCCSTLSEQLSTSGEYSEDDSPAAPRAPRAAVGAARGDCLSAGLRKAAIARSNLELLNAELEGVDDYIGPLHPPRAATGSKPLATSDRSEEELLEMRRRLILLQELRDKRNITPDEEVELSLLVKFFNVRLPPIQQTCLYVSFTPPVDSCFASNCRVFVHSTSRRYRWRRW